MKKNVMTIIAIILGCIILGVCFVFCRNIFMETRYRNRKIIEIKDYNSDIVESVSKFRHVKNTLQVLLGETYADNVDEKYDNIVLLLNREYDALKVVESTVFKLDTYCEGEKYSDASVNGICLEYKKSYEEVINGYVYDIEHINRIFQVYNKNHSKQLEYYKSSQFGDYVDYNQDGILSGNEA